MLNHIVTLVSMRPDSLPLWQYFFGVQTRIGWVCGAAGLTGIFLLCVFLVMVLFPLPCVRRRGFYWKTSSQLSKLDVVYNNYYYRCSTGSTTSLFPGIFYWFSMAPTCGNGSQLPHWSTWLRGQWDPGGWSWQDRGISMLSRHQLCHLRWLVIFLGICELSPTYFI